MNTQVEYEAVVQKEKHIRWSTSVQNIMEDRRNPGETLTMPPFRCRLVKRNKWILGLQN